MLKFSGSKDFLIFFIGKLNILSFIASQQTFSHSLHFHQELMHTTLPAPDLIQDESHRSILELHYTKYKDLF